MSSVLLCFLGQFGSYTSQVFVEVFGAKYAGGM